VNRDLVGVNRTSRDFRGEMSSREAVSRRPPNPSNTIVARTEGYTHAAEVWDSSLVQGPFSVAPSCPTDNSPQPKEALLTASQL
jgi:hypothetical protein